MFAARGARYGTGMGSARRWPWSVAVVLAAAGAVGCITTLAPNIRREAHHSLMTPTSTGAACLKCHEAESAMARRMAGMSSSEMARHMNPDGVIRPPLVADWMIKEKRGCVGCHALKEPRS